MFLIFIVDRYMVSGMDGDGPSQGPSHLFCCSVDCTYVGKELKRQKKKKKKDQKKKGGVLMEEEEEDIAMEISSEDETPQKVAKKKTTKKKEAKKDKAEEPKKKIKVSVSDGHEAQRRKISKKSFRAQNFCLCFFGHPNKPITRQNIPAEAERVVVDFSYFFFLFFLVEGCCCACTLCFLESLVAAALSSGHHIHRDGKFQIVSSRSFFFFFFFFFFLFLNSRSYAGKKVVGPFHKSFSAVVGPNGSGKSNVIDALQFVFGKRAAKIRFKKLADLIHNSTFHANVPRASVVVSFAYIIDKPDGTFDTVCFLQFFSFDADSFFVRFPRRASLWSAPWFVLARATISWTAIAATGAR